MRRIILGLLLAILLISSLSPICLAAASYRLTIKDGHLAVQDCQSGAWTMVTDTPASALPAADRILLREGIFCSATELPILLEDYTS